MAKKAVKKKEPAARQTAAARKARLVKQSPAAKKVAPAKKTPASSKKVVVKEAATGRKASVSKKELSPGAPHSCAVKSGGLARHDSAVQHNIIGTWLRRSTVTGRFHGKASDQRIASTIRYSVGGSPKKKGRKKSLKR